MPEIIKAPIAAMNFLIQVRSRIDLRQHSAHVQCHRAKLNQGKDGRITFAVQFTRFRTAVQ
jgi:hypothetical protein